MALNSSEVAVRKSTSSVGAPSGRPVVGAGVFVVVQSFFLLIRVATGGEVRVSRIITAFSLALVASIFGGVLGSFMQNSGVRPK